MLGCGRGSGGGRRALGAAPWLALGLVAGGPAGAVRSDRHAPWPAPNTEQKEDGEGAPPEHLATDFWQLYTWTAEDLQDEVRELRHAARGERNDTLRQEAKRLLADALDQFLNVTTHEGLEGELAALLRRSSTAQRDAQGSRTPVDDRPALGPWLRTQALLGVLVLRLWGLVREQEPNTVANRAPSAGAPPQRFAAAPVTAQLRAALDAIASSKNPGLKRLAGLPGFPQARAAAERIKDPSASPNAHPPARTSACYSAPRGTRVH